MFLQINAHQKKETKKEKAIRCIRNVLSVEQQIGLKIKEFEETGEVMRKLINRRNTIDADNKEKMQELYILEKQSPDFTFDQFKRYCYIKSCIERNDRERPLVSERLAKLTQRSNKLNSEINASYNKFKCFAFEKKKLL